MIRSLLLISLILCLCFETSLADEIDNLLKKALDARNSEVRSDSSARQRYLYEILQKDPDHLEALWQMALIKINSLSNSSLNRRAPYLAALGPDINKILEIAEKKRDTAYYHYVKAVYASQHMAYDTALGEIEKSIRLEPNSVRYLLNKGQILMYKGIWTKSDSDIEQGLTVIQKALDLSQKHENPFHNPWHYNSLMADGNTYFTKSRWQEVIVNNEKSIDIMEKANATEVSAYAFAWNDISNAYRKLGDCDKSLYAAEQALKVMEFGAAKNQKRSAELCIEMQQIVDGTVINTI